MEPLLEAGADIELRRQSVASWIQGNVRPVANLIANNILAVDDEEILQEAIEFEVREYQLDAWGSVWAARQAGAKSALIHLATGLGKTSVGVFDVMKFTEEFKVANGREPKILFTCHKNEILEQAAERFRAFMPSASQGFYNGDSKDKDAQITFATLQSLYADLGSFTPHDYDYIIDDEVHHAKADTFDQVVRYFNPAFRLGLTATPNRKDEKDIRELYGEEVYSKGLPEALAEGLLASPDYHIVFDDAVKEAMQSGFEAPSLRALAELFDVQPRNEIIAKNIKEEMARIGLEFGEVKTIVFCQNIEHAEEMAELLGGKAYHSEAPRSERRDTFEEFKNGGLQVITTRDMFNEGVDIPDARLLVFLRSTSSQTIFEQQLGRGLRKHAGKERVSVLDFVANVERIAMIKELADSVKTSNATNRHGSGNDSEGDDDESGGTIIDGPEVFGQGLTIHAGNADFDFDKMTVDLLEKFKALNGRNSLFKDLDKEGLIKLALEISPNSPLTLSAIKELSADREFPSQTIIFSNFGSIREFQKACGFDVKEMSKLTDEELIELALELSPDSPLTNEKIAELSKNGLFVSTSNIAKRFGRVTEFQKMCGFSPKRENHLGGGLAAASTADLIALAKDLSPDKPLSAATVKKLNKEGKFMSVGAIQGRFGSLSEFQVACGFEVEKPGPLTPADIVAKALEISPDTPLNTTQIKSLSASGAFPGLTTIKRHFGNIQNFYIACGFTEVDTSRYLRNSQE